MMAPFNKVRTAALAVLILAGLCAQGSRTQAAEARTLTVAGGCFWCVEADFEQVAGVSEVVSGFTAYSGACTHPFRQHAPTDSGVSAHL